MQNTPILLRCLIGDQTIRSRYRTDLLDDADAVRAARSPGLASRTDWQVSRTLKQYARKQYAGRHILSLSHSKGCAAVLFSDDLIQAGIDLEAVRQRDFDSLAAWVCSNGEQRFLRALPVEKHAEQFYRLWTVKEALIKAAHLTFPADMKNVGYRFENGKIAGLRVAGKTDWQGETVLLHTHAETFALSTVWQGNNIRIDRTLHGSRTQKLPASTETYPPVCKLQPTPSVLG